MSGVYSKVNGKFNISQINSKYNNNWRDTYQIYKKDDSSWEKVYNYWYEYSDWSDCSVSCGGWAVNRTRFTYSDYDPWTNTYHAFGVNC